MKLLFPIPIVIGFFLEKIMWSEITKFGQEKLNGAEQAAAGMLIAFDFMLMAFIAIGVLFAIGWLLTEES